MANVVNTNAITEVLKIYIQFGVCALAANAYARRRRTDINAVVSNQTIAVALTDEELGPRATDVVRIGNEYARSGITPIRNIELTLAVNTHAVVAAPGTVTVVNLIAYTNTIDIIQIDTVASIEVGYTVTCIDGTHLGTLRRLVDCNEQLSAVGLAGRVDAVDGGDGITLNGYGPGQLAARLNAFEFAHVDSGSVFALLNIGNVNGSHCGAFLVVECDVSIIGIIIGIEGELVTVVVQTVSKDAGHAGLACYVGLPLGDLVVLHQVQVDVLTINVSTC